MQFIRQSSGKLKISAGEVLITLFVLFTHVCHRNLWHMTTVINQQTTQQRANSLKSADKLSIEKLKSLSWTDVKCLPLRNSLNANRR